MDVQPHGRATLGRARRARGRLAGELAGRTRRGTHRLALRVKRRFALFDPVEVVPYLGYGTTSSVSLLGRVLERGGTVAAPRDSSWRNLLNTLHALESDEIPGARLRASFGGRTWEATTDDEGYFGFELVADPPLAPGWHNVEIELLGSIAGGAGQRAVGRVLVPSPAAEFGVISDVDDTVVRTAVTDLLMLIRIVLFTNAHTRTPFPGVAALYQALRAGPSGAGDNPIFYVSQSGWNLYPLLRTFMELHDIPVGPLLLRDFGFLGDQSSALGKEDQKLSRIRAILRTYPTLPFVLIGDSGQHDPEIYRQVVREHPGRIRAIYIRDVTTARRDREVDGVAADLRALGVPMLLVHDSVRAAEHAAAHGLISPDALPAVRGRRAEDVRPIRGNG